MINREDIVFATCNQLSQLISDDWGDPPSEIKLALEGLRAFDEPGRGYQGIELFSSNTLNMMPSEKEPEYLIKGRRLYMLRLAITLLSIVMTNSDGWQTNDSDILKRELTSRIANYEEQSKSIVTPIPFKCNITV